MEAWGSCAATYIIPCLGVAEAHECSEKADTEKADGTDLDKLAYLGDCLYGKALKNNPLDPAKAMDAYNAANEALETCGNPPDDVEASTSIISLHSNVSRHGSESPRPCRNHFKLGNFRIRTHGAHLQLAPTL